MKKGSALDILASAYRALHESDGFDALLEHWDARLSGAERRTDPETDTMVDDDRALEQESGDRVDQFRSLLDRTPNPVGQSGVFNAIVDAPGPAIVLTPDLRVLASNAAGQDAYHAKLGARPDFAWLDEDGLAAIGAMAQAVRRQEMLPSRIIRTFQHNRSGLAEIAAIHGERASGLLIALRGLGFAWNAQVEASLKAMFELTQGECEVARLTLDLADLPEVAKKRGTAIRTVRTQLSQIYLKTGCKGQAELVRFLAALCARCAGQGGAGGANAANSSPASWRDPLGREAFIDGPYGRTAFSWMGREGGRPGILIHAPLTGYVLAPRVQEILHTANIQLFAPSRPGFGNSEAASGADAVTAGAATIGAMMDHLDLESAPLVGMVNGFVPALRFAHDHSERVSGLLSLGACLPIDTPQRRSHLPATQRVLLELAQRAPVTCEWIVRLGLRNVAARGPEFLLARMYSESEVDTKVAFEPETLAILMASTSLMSAQDHQAIFKDLSLISCSFGDWLDASGPPITMLAGAKDPVFSIERVRAQAQFSARLNVIEVRDAGQTVAFSHAEEAGAAICRLFEQH